MMADAMREGSMSALREEVAKRLRFIVHSNQRT
jgi:hypothetical protein